MALYITLFLILALVALFGSFPLNFRGRILRSSVALVAFVVFWALASFRWKTGTDWDSYYDTFYYFSDIYAKLFEPGFAFFVGSVRDFTDNYTIYLAIFSFLCIGLKMRYFFALHPTIILTIIWLYFCYYFADIFAVRQNLAISFTLFSTYFIIHRKPIPFLIFVGIATSLHVTSALYFIAYAVYWKGIKEKTLLILMFVSIFLGLIGIGPIILGIMMKLIGLGGHLGDKITMYLSEDSGAAVSTNNNSVVIYFLGLMKRLLLLPIFFYMKRRLHSGIFDGYLKLYIVGNVIYFLFAKDLVVFSRASVPFIFFEVFLIALSLQYLSRKRKTAVVAFIIVSILAFSRFNALVNSYYHLYVPYNSIFDYKVDRVLE